MEEKNESEVEVKKTGAEKREEMLEYYNRRRALIHSKYPDIQKAPSSVQIEETALHNIISALRSSRNPQWGIKESSDGIEIDSFQERTYEAALESYTKANEENSQYITKEDDEAFELRPYNQENVDRIAEAADGIKTYEDQQWFLEKYATNPYLTTIKYQDAINRIRNEVARKTFPTKEELHAKEEPKVQIESEGPEGHNGSNLPVEESKFASIYHGIKEKAKTLGNFFKGLKDKIMGREEQTKSTDEREEK